MTIDDELLLELIKPERHGEVGKDTLFVKVVGTRKIDYKLEEPIEYQNRNDAIQRTYSIMTPDIIVTTRVAPFMQIAIEIENDIHWDFQASLRQVKNYQQKFQTRIIIPKDYERFAPLYKKAGFRVFLWTAKRRWQCLRCGTETIKEGPVTPKCSNSKCKNNSANEFRLVGLKDTDIKEF